MWTACYILALSKKIRLQTTQKKQVSTIQINIHRQFYNSLTDTPTEQAILLSQSTSHTGAHLMQPRSEAYEVEDRCFRASVARRLMLPHPAAANLADVVQFCANKSVGSSVCTSASFHLHGHPCRAPECCPFFDSLFLDLLLSVCVSYLLFFYLNPELNLFLHVVVIGAMYHWHSAK